ncbi:MAG: hypothetical protein V7K98_15765 [Nostoc sp.]|uniref:hypothetical protein n=1 Tax=Nostoc sp. TaxID=1180 RepID=UPI002FF5A928
MTSLRLTHKAKKKQLRSWLRIGSTGCLAPRLTTSQSTHPPINLTIDVGRSWFRRRPAIHPHRADGWGIPPNSLNQGQDFILYLASLSL